MEEATLLYPAMLALLSVCIPGCPYDPVDQTPVHASQAADETEFDKLLSDAGYAYDPIQDIFITKMDAWQRKYGYCALYDEAAVAAGMIIVSEPVRFEYEGSGG